MRILVTGSTGFIGSHFLRLLDDQKIDFVAQRRTPKSKPRLKLSPSVTWLTAQLSEVESFDFSEIDVIVHLAAHSMKPPYDNFENCIRYNVVDPLKLFEKAIKSGVRRIVVAGSCFEYGLSGQQHEFIPVNAQLLPTNTYAMSKAAASISFYQLAVQYDVELFYHRIFQVYGDGEDESRLFPSLMKAAREGVDFPMTEGQQVRDFINVEEVAVKLLESCVVSMEQKIIFKNLGSGIPKSILEFSREIWTLLGAEGKLMVGALPYRENEVMRFVPLIEDEE